MGEICFQIFMILRLKSGVCALAYQSPGHFWGGLVRQRTVGDPLSG